MAETASPETKLAKAVACKIHEGPSSYSFISLQIAGQTDSTIAVCERFRTNLQN
jgi:hypothetical protein